LSLVIDYEVWEIKWYKAYITNKLSLVIDYEVWEIKW